MMLAQADRMQESARTPLRGSSSRRKCFSNPSFDVRSSHVTVVMLFYSDAFLSSMYAGSLQPSRLFTFKLEEELTTVRCSLGTFSCNAHLP